jgi:transposase
VSDARWALIEPVLTAWQQDRLARSPAPLTPKYQLREIWNALLYLNRTGCQWQYLPHDFPHYQTVYRYYAAWRDEGILERLRAGLTRLARVKAGHAPEPTAAVMDTQSVKTAGTVPAAEQGPDAAKKITGRKRGILTDTLGLLLAVTVTAASLTENQAGIALLTQARADHPAITRAWADQGFKSQAIRHGAALGIDVEVVPRQAGARGFHVLKRRWVAERTFGWLMMHRRLARDYETKASSSRAMIHLAMTDNLAKRITGETQPTWRDTTANPQATTLTI